MHLLVLSAFRHHAQSLAFPFQLGLNAPFGAQCFPTRHPFLILDPQFVVSMHLLVLSAFRPVNQRLGVLQHDRSQCTFWCSVLSDKTLKVLARFGETSLNAPFGAQCFPTAGTTVNLPSLNAVSMHLLVLSAFRLTERKVKWTSRKCLNAPFGAQCFPTCRRRRRRQVAPWSQCTFWCSVLSDSAVGAGRHGRRPVSMHLLVLSAFRHLHKRMLGDLVPLSQCTFWCSVLSDG